MLILLSKIQAKEENLSLYAGISLNEDAMHSLTSDISDIKVNKAITKDMLYDILFIKKSALLDKYKAYSDSVNWLPPSNFWSDEKTETVDDIHIGVDGMDCQILTLDGDGNIISGAENQILVKYTDSTAKETLGYLISTYNVETKQYTVKRITPEDLDEMLQNDVAFINATYFIDDEGTAQVMSTGFGFETGIDTKKLATFLDKADKERISKMVAQSTLKDTRKTVLNTNFTAATASILEFLDSAKNVLTEEQHDFLVKYYTWYIKKCFELILGSSKVETSPLRKAMLDELKIKSNANWTFSGCAYDNSQTIQCSDPSCGRRLKKAYIFEADIDGQGTAQLMFGLNCAKAFFEIDGNGLDTLDESTKKVEAEIKELNNALMNPVKDTDGRTQIEAKLHAQKMFANSIKQLEASDKADGKNRLGAQYGDTAEWLVGFIDNTLPIPATLNLLMMNLAYRKTAAIEQQQNATPTKSDPNKNTNMRIRPLNAVTADDLVFDENVITEYWMALHPEYTDLVTYLPESKDYYIFLYKYKLFSLPMEGDALRKFNDKHPRELKHLAWDMGAITFSTDECAHIASLLRLEKNISDEFLEKLKAKNFNYLTNREIVYSVKNKFTYKYTPDYISWYSKDRYPKETRIGAATYATAALRTLLEDTEKPAQFTTGAKPRACFKVITNPKYRLLADNLSSMNVRTLKPTTQLDSLAEDKTAVLTALTNITEKRADYEALVDEALDDLVRKNDYNKSVAEREAKEAEHENKLNELRKQVRVEDTVSLIDLDSIYDSALYHEINHNGESVTITPFAKLDSCFPYTVSVLAIKVGAEQCVGIVAEKEYNCKEQDYYFTGNVAIVCNYRISKIELGDTYDSINPEVLPKYVIPKFTAEVTNNEIIVKDETGSISLVCTAAEDRKTMAVDLKYTNKDGSEGASSVQDIDIRSQAEKDEEAKDKLLKQAAAIQAAKIAYRTATYPEKIDKDIKIIKDSDIANLLFDIESDVNAGKVRLTTSKWAFNNVMATILGNIRSKGKSPCSVKQYSYIYKVIKEYQDAIGVTHQAGEQSTSATQPTSQTTAQPAAQNTTQSRDLVDIAKNLYKQYGKDGITKTLASEISNATTYSKLDNAGKKAICDAICRYISRYQLDKTNPEYGFDLIPDENKTDIHFINNEPEFRDTLYKISANPNNLGAKDKNRKEFAILTSVLNFGTYSNKQKPYLDRLVSEYEIYMGTYSQDAVDKDAEKE